MTFVKGHIPHNKGRKSIEYMTEDGMKNSRKTCFRPGNKPHNVRTELSTTIRQRKDGRKDMYIRFDGRTIPYSHYIWEKATGEKVLKGEIVRFIDGDHFNFDISNLQKVTRAENARLNSTHRKWTKEETELLICTYPTTSMSDLMRIFNCDEFRIDNKAFELKLKKDPDYISDLVIAEYLHHGKSHFLYTFLENKGLIAFKRSQILLSRKIKKVNGGC